MPKKKTNRDSYDELVNITCINENYDDAVDYRNILEPIKKKSLTVISSVFKTHKPNTIEDVNLIIETLNSFGRGTKEEKMIFCYGAKEGKIKFNSYKNKQSVSNSYEYKRDNYGWSKEEFNTYNKSRAVTKETMAKKYGEEEGKIKYDNYCNKQAVNGNKLEYFVSEYGVEEGKIKYDEICKKKGHTFENYTRLYGDKAEDKLIEFNTRLFGFHSKISQDLFGKLCNKYEIFNKNVYYADLNNEYGLYSHEFNSFYKYDFVSTYLKIAIEFHGDHYHGNPRYYRPDDILKGRGQSKKTASEAWIVDQQKEKALMDERGFDLITIWEYDYRNDNLKTIKDIYEYVKKIRQI